MILPSSENIAGKALFFDRDGTLMEEVSYCSNPQDVKIFEGLVAQLEKTRQQGWLHIIATNQSGIGRGYFTEADFQAVQRELQHQLHYLIDDTYMAPDVPGNQSLRRKPAPGMLLEAAKAHHIDLKRSFMIGDKAIDMECGRAAGCKTILVLTGYGKKESPSDADYIVADVIEALDLVLSLEKHHTVYSIPA